MRVVLDTNILVSALISKSAAPYAIYQAWRDKKLELLTCEAQLTEVREVTRRIAIAVRIKPSEAGLLMNSLRYLATMQTDLSAVQRSSDPKDDFLLGLAQAGRAEYLVTGDKSGLLALRSHKGTKIVRANWFAERALG
jgi:uncharacterized protein